jgi:hypothetical protein
VAHTFTWNGRFYVAITSNWGSGKIRNEFYRWMGFNLSILQMPGGVPVATVALNGAKNAGILAAQIISESRYNGHG